LDDKLIPTLQKSIADLEKDMQTMKAGKADKIKRANSSENLVAG
jgi:hypothetical protein